MKVPSIIFIPRAREWVKSHPDLKINALDEAWGNPALCKVRYSNDGVFDFPNEGCQIYVIAGHGAPGKNTCCWGGDENTISAEETAFQIRQKFPVGDFGTVKLKIYSCHSAEGGTDAFASQVGAALKTDMKDRAGTLKVFGYEGAVTTKPITLTGGNVSDANQLFTAGGLYSKREPLPGKDGAHKYTKKPYKADCKSVHFYGRASGGRLLIVTLEFVG